MNDKIYTEMGKARLTGTKTEGIPMWGINHYFKIFCDNYTKLIMLVRLCHGSWDKEGMQIAISKESVPLSYDKQKIEQFMFRNEDYLNYHENEDRFWLYFRRCERPLVYRKTSEGRLIPFYNYYEKEAVKITDVSYNSPISIEVQGIVDGIVDLATASSRYEMERREHEARQVDNLARGLNSIVRAAQVIDDPRTPEGIRYYAQNELKKLILKQGKLNEQLGISEDRTDIRI